MSLLAELNTFTGTSQYYKASPLYNLNLTDGTKYLAEKTGCYWLIDIVGSYQGEPKVKAEGFQVWKLKVNDDKSAVVTCEDGNYNEIIRQDIPFTDFPLKEISVWVQNGVCFLPSEY